MPRLVTVVDPFGLWRRGARLGRRGAGGLADAAEQAALGLIDLAVRTAIDEGVVEEVADRLLAAGVAERIAERAVAGPELDRLLEATLESPRVAQLAERALESDGMERLVAQVLDSRLADATVARVLASDELWLVVEEVAQSPAVTAAITQQSAGFADQVAGEVGRRSRRADARLERLARRMLHRAPAPGSP